MALVSAIQKATATTITTTAAQIQNDDDRFGLAQYYQEKKGIFSKMLFYSRCVWMNENEEKTVGFRSGSLKAICELL